MLQQTTIKMWDVNIDNIVISKLVKIKNNLKYLIAYLGRTRDRDSGQRQNKCFI